MKITYTKPPPLVWDGCHANFDIDDAHTVYTYGDTLYNPAGLPIEPALEEHEGTHAKQQAAFTGGPDAWWKKYLTVPAFRAEQEVEAYAAQYKFYCRTHKDRNQRMRYLWNIESDLTGGMYGLTMSRGDARAAIKARAGV